MTRRPSDTQTILRHWREAVPNDRLAHLVKDATRALVRALSLSVCLGLAIGVAVPAGEGLEGR